MARWTACAYAGEFTFDASSLAARWRPLHAGDREPLPGQAEVLQAWAHYHAGDFERAVDAGLAAGGAGITAANKAAATYAAYVEPSESRRLSLLLETADRARQQTEREPANPNAWYWQAFCLGRYSQGISVARALAQGLGPRIRAALERTIALQPLHADAHIALGSFHAEVIDKVGPMVGAMTHGASKEVGARMFRAGLRLNPHSAMAMLEAAQGLLMLEGEAAREESDRLCETAGMLEALDCAERLCLERARAELQD